MKRRFTNGSAGSPVLAALLLSCCVAVNAVAADNKEQAVADIRVVLDSWSGEGTTLEHARRELGDVLIAHPDYPPAYKELARYHIKHGSVRGSVVREDSLVAAEAALDRAIQIDPEYADGYVLFGHLYRLQGEPEKGFAALDTAENLGSKNPWLYLNRADLLLDAGDTAAAVAMYQAVLDSGTAETNPRHTAYAGLIRYYTWQQEFAKVDELYREQIAFEPGFAWPHSNYAKFLLFHQGDYEAAIEHSSDALEIMHYGDARFVLASALLMKWAVLVEQSQDSEEATLYLQTAFSIYPNLDRMMSEAAKYPATHSITTAANTYLVANEDNGYLLAKD